MNNIKSVLYKLILVTFSILLISCGVSGGTGADTSGSSPATQASYPVVINNTTGGSSNIVPGGFATFGISLNSDQNSSAKANTSSSNSYTVQLSLQNAVPGVTLSTNQVVLNSDSSPSSSFAVNVDKNVTISNPNQGMAVIAIINGQHASYPLNIKVVAPGSLEFTNSTGTVNLLLGTVQQVTLQLTPVTESQTPNVVANITSSSPDYLIVTPAQCLLNSSNLSCTITLFSQSVIGDYKVSAVAPGYNTNCNMNHGIV